MGDATVRKSNVGSVPLSNRVPKELDPRIYWSSAKARRRESPWGCNGRRDEVIVSGGPGELQLGALATDGLVKVDPNRDDVIRPKVH